MPGPSTPVEHLAGGAPPGTANHLAPSHGNSGGGEAIVFVDLSKNYGDNVALDRVSFAVGQGETFGLLGPNGAGKTTLIRILMDILRADSGSMVLFGKPYRRDQLARVGYLPEERGLYIKHRVLEVMTYFGTLKDLPRKEARERSLRWLQRLDLGHTARWKIERLSKGMGQKVQIASALLPDPELCVLDEPFSGLDPVNVRLVEDLIAERRAAGRTTILSTHQIHRVEGLCDRVAMIDRGKLKLYGSVQDVRRSHSLPEVRLESPDPLPDLEDPLLAGVQACTDEGSGTYRLLLDDGVSPQSLLRRWVQSGLRIDRFEKVLTPLEDIFIHQVKQDGPEKVEVRRSAGQAQARSPESVPSPISSREEAD